MPASDGMVSDAFRELLEQRAVAAGISLVSAQLDLLTQYFKLLRKWNRVINLTALPLELPSDRTINRLFIEPLQAVPFVGEGAHQWLDLGSGGGSPAIPLKVARPDVSLTMVEARSRKAAFLREVIASMGLTATSVLTSRIGGRAREPQPGLADLITIRAVRLESDLLGAARTLLQPRGRLLLFGSKSMSARKEGLQLREQVFLVGGESTLQVLVREE